MSNYKIAGLLIPMATSKQVIMEFARYIKDAHPANAEHLTALVSYAMKKEKLTDADFDKEKVFKALFPTEGYKLSRIDRIYARGITLAENFLLGWAFMKNPHIKIFLLVESMKYLQLEQLAKKKLMDNLENLPKEEAENFAVSSKTHMEIYFKTETNFEEKKKNRHHLIAALRDKEIEGIISKLKLCCEIIGRKLLWGEEYEEGVKEMIDRTLAQIPYRDEILIVDLLAKSAFLLQNPSVEHYYDLKASFLKESDKLFSEKREILFTLINALPFIKLEDRSAEYFELIRFGVDKGYFLEDGIISSSFFNNIVKAACLVKEVQWAREFIQSHSQYLNKPPELLENIKNMNRCFLLFGEGKYQAVLENLDKILLEDYSYGLHRYNLSLRATYEVKKSEGREELLRIINAYRGYVNYKVKQELLSVELRQEIFNFLKIFHQIIDYPYKNYTKDQLLSNLDKFEEKIIGKAWLIEKIKQLKRY